MRILVLMVLLLIQIPLIALAQELPFIPWNTSQSEAKVFMQKQGFNFYKENPNSHSNIMTFTQPIIYGYGANIVAYLYFNEQALTNVRYDRQSSAESLDVWEAYLKETSKRLGNPIIKEYTVPSDTKSRLIGHIMYGNAKASAIWELNSTGEPTRIECFVGKDGNVHISMMNLNRYKAQAETDGIAKTMPSKIQQTPTVNVSVDDYQSVLASLPRLGTYGSLPLYMKAVMADGGTGIYEGAYNNLKIGVELRNGKLIQLTIEPNGIAQSIDSDGLIQTFSAYYGSATYQYPTNYRWVFSNNPIRTIDLLPDKGRIMGIWQ